MMERILHSDSEGKWHPGACISHKTYKIIILAFSGVLNAVFYFLSYLCVAAILTALEYRPSAEEGPAATQTSFLPWVAHPQAW
jgi:hypothetical protein